MVRAILRNRRVSSALAGVATAASLVLVAVSAPVEVAAGTVVGTVTVYGPEDVEGFVVGEGEGAYLDFPGSRPWAVTSVGGPYSPMPVDEVVEALEALTYPTDLLEVAVLVLGRPRRDVPQSSAEGTVVFLSPGRIDYPTEHVHYAVAHEIGHVLHHALMPDSREDLWEQYAGLRAIDPASSGSAADHATRIHEIFAEDFRALFGGALSQCGSGVENHDLAPPDEVRGLREFFLALPGVWKDAARICVEPNPFNDRLAIRVFSLADEARIGGAAIYDVEGRLVATVAPSAPSSREIIWDGRNSDGIEAAAGLYFAAVSGASKTQVVKVLRIRR